MVIAHESPDTRTLIFQQTLPNEKILKINEEEWMDVWVLFSEKKEPRNFFLSSVVLRLASPP